MPNKGREPTKIVFFSQGLLDALSLSLLNKFDELIDYFGVKLQQDSVMYHGCCPIHEGDNRTAFNLYKVGDTAPGYWCCWTKHCERKFKATPIGFVRAMLSKQNNKTVSFKDTIDWICGFTGQDISNIKVDESGKEQKDFVGCINKLTPKHIEHKGIPRLQVRSKLEIPARFFLERKFPPEILDRFDVGYCADLSKPMGGRVVVPVYDESRLTMVACSGRTVCPKCLKCGMYHLKGKDCPHKDPYKNLRFAKWRHSGNINSYLYNYWNSRSLIKKTGTVVIVEGPCDVWRLVQYGVENVVALTGNTLSDSQQILLEMSGAMNVIDCLDNDEAGKAGSEQLKKKLSMFMNMYKPVYSGKDVGELTEEQFKVELLPLVEKLR